MVFVSSGATCARGRSAIPEFAPPLVFSSGQPTLTDLIQQTNRSLAIQTLASNTLTIDSQELAHKLSGSFRWERPHNLRLETKLFSSALGMPLAAGSNSDMFWLQIQRPSPTLYYASHDQFENQHGPRHVLPVSPLWLREAFGIVELDPNGQHEGPITRPDGRLQVTSFIPSPRGDYRRVLVMAAKTGTVEETLLYNQVGKLVAHARMSDHQYYAAIDWSLPHRVAVQLHPDVGEPLSFAVDAGLYLINQPVASSNGFMLPDSTGMSTVDLVQANASMQSASLPAQRTLATPVSTGGQTLTPTPPVYRTDTASPTSPGWQNYIVR
ncbi:MAG: hypothetical protein KF752_14080 [Pirellulaceae bacterium]|nr:hypothetical protein [Pirellulaceae bacterium]